MGRCETDSRQQRLQVMDQPWRTDHVFTSENALTTHPLVSARPRADTRTRTFTSMWDHDG